MFTGLVETMGRIGRIARPIPTADAFDLVVDIPFADDLQIGDSVAVDGCCLTVLERQGTDVRFQVGPETLRRTTLEGRKAGDHVNLERALRADQRFGGHFVQGHIDGVGTVIHRERVGEFEFVRIECGPLMREIAPKGSVAVDGVSLTVVNAEDETLQVMLIPHTMAATTLGERVVGSKVNVETDVLAKYVSRMLSGWIQPPSGAK